MWVERLDAQGLRWTRDAREPDTVDVLLGGEQRALLLWALALDPTRGDVAEAALGSGVALDDAPEDEVHDLTVAAGVGAHWFAAREVTITARVRLDPPLFGELRRHAAREPALGIALADSPTVTVRVGWLATPDGTVLRPSVLAVAVGELGLPSSRRERPAWVPKLLRDLSHRVGVVQLTDETSVAMALQQGAESGLPGDRAAVSATHDAVKASPLGVTGLGWVRHLDALRLVGDADLRPLSDWGPEALHWVQCLHGAYASGADVLVVPVGIPPEWSDYLDSWLDSDGAPVEQWLGLERP